MTFRSQLKCSAVIILMINNFCGFSQYIHELNYFVGCFDNGTTAVQLEYNSEEILYVDFKKETVEYTGPPFVKYDPSQIFQDLKIYQNAKKNKNACIALEKFSAAETGYPPEERDPPESVLYTEEEPELGVENSLICFINHFYPPAVEISWTKNGNPVTKGVSLSRYYPNEDQTFHLFSTLAFTPTETDFYSCTVEHSALEMPKTRTWVPDFGHQTHKAHGLDAFCAVGLILGLLGVAVGTFLMARAFNRN